MPTLLERRRRRGRSARARAVTPSVVDRWTNGGCRDSQHGPGSGARGRDVLQQADERADQDARAAHGGVAVGALAVERGSGDVDVRPRDLLLAAVTVAGRARAHE